MKKTHLSLMMMAIAIFGFCGNMYAQNDENNGSSAVVPTPGTDMTSFIVNPSFEEGTKGWTGLGSENPSFHVTDSKNWEKYTEGNYFVERSCQASATLNNQEVYQDITGLPNGLYKVSANVRCEQQSDNKVQDGLYLVANNVSSGSNVFSNSKDYCEVYVIVKDGTLKVGFKNESTGGNRSCVDNFHLVYVSPLDANLIFNPNFRILEHDMPYSVMFGWKVVDNTVAEPSTGVMGGAYAKEDVAFRNFNNAEGSELYTLNGEPYNHSTAAVLSFDKLGDYGFCSVNSQYVYGREEGYELALEAGKNYVFSGMMSTLAKSEKTHTSTISIIQKSTGELVKQIDVTPAACVADSLSNPDAFEVRFNTGNADPEGLYEIVFESKDKSAEDGWALVISNLNLCVENEQGGAGEVTGVVMPDASKVSDRPAFTISGQHAKDGAKGIVIGEFEKNGRVLRYKVIRSLRW